MLKYLTNSSTYQKKNEKATSKKKTGLYATFELVYAVTLTLVVLFINTLK